MERSMIFPLNKNGTSEDRSAYRQRSTALLRHRHFAVFALVLCFTTSTSMMFWRTQVSVIRQMRLHEPPVALGDSNNTEVSKGKTVESSASSAHLPTINTIVEVPAASLQDEARIESDASPGTAGNTAPSNVSTDETIEEETQQSTHDSNEMPPSKKRVPCANSDRWLKGPRYGNLHDDPLLTYDLAKQMLLNLKNVLLNDSKMPDVLGQTICHANSRLLQSTQSVPLLLDDDRTVRLWAVKLIYLSIYYHQHRLAGPEAEARYSHDNSICPSAAQLAQDHGVGLFDYECPDAKYLIMPLGGNGLGANVRGGMVPALMMGLVTNRIVVFVNHAEKGDDSSQSPWPLASCPRRDYQCFFWALTPCTLTQDEIGDAYILSMSEYRPMMYRGKLPESIDHHKVWQFNTPYTPITNFFHLAAEALYERALELISVVPEADHPEYVALLRKAAETIRIDDGVRMGYHYAAATFKIQHTLALYSMRPNPRNAQELERILSEIIPRDFEPETSLGLPIRASDKCEGESECLSFDQHMQVASDMWQRHSNLTSTVAHPTVVFTTESKNMVKEQQAFVAENGEQKYPFNFDFVTNTQDATPDSGFMNDIVSNGSGELDADALMLSAVSSLKAQLLPRVSIGNCCSNFHVLLNDLLSEGCGAASDNTFLCLQEHDDPMLRVCCGWQEQCKKEKQLLFSATTT